MGGVESQTRRSGLPQGHRRSPLSCARLIGARFAPILFVLAVAGALAGKKVSPAGLGTMRTDNPTFVFLLIGIVILVGALTFFPAILLGPVANGLSGRLF